MKDFLEALKEVDRTSERQWPWQKCRICVVLEELDEPEAQGLRLVLANKKVTNKQISDLIFDYFGYQVNPTRHRQGNCKGS